MAQINRQFLLREVPRGKLGLEHFQYNEAAMPTPADGEVLVRVLYYSLDAGARVMQHDVDYLAQPNTGGVMGGATLAEVVESRSPGFAPGDIVTAGVGWQEYAALPARRLTKRDATPPLSHLLSVLGTTGVTAYFGLLDCAPPKAGETVVVSSAGGAVGSLVGGIARLKGCRTVGIAGGPAKCARLITELGFDAAVDYKAGDLGQALSEACPDGIDVYFDNVGGEMFQTCLHHMAEHGRMVVCGLTSQYDGAPTPPPPVQGLPRLFVTKRLNVRGIVVWDYYTEAETARREAALADLKRWVESGQLKVPEDIIEGFEHLPAALVGLLAGDNFGKRLVKAV